MKDAKMNDLIKQLYLARNSLARFDALDQTLIVHKVGRCVLGDVIVEFCYPGESYPTVAVSIDEVSPCEISDAVRKQFASQCDPYGYFYNIMEWLYDKSEITRRTFHRGKISFYHEDEFVCEMLERWMHQFSRMTYMTVSFDLEYARALFHKWGKIMPNGSKQFSKHQINQLIYRNKTRLMAKNPD